MVRQKFPRTLREAFQNKNNPPLTLRESRHHGPFREQWKARVWRTVKSIILGA